MIPDNNMGGFHDSNSWCRRYISAKSRPSSYTKKVINSWNFMRTTHCAGSSHYPCSSTKVSQILETISKVDCDPKKFPKLTKKEQTHPNWRLHTVYVNNLCLTTMKICFPCSSRFSRDSSSLALSFFIIFF